MSYSTTATLPVDGAHAIEIVEAVEAVTASEAGALGRLASWCRYVLSVCGDAAVGVTASSTEFVVAATSIAFCQAAVAKPCALSLTNARICEPDDAAPRSLASCAGLVRRTAAIRPGCPLRDIAIAFAIEPTLAAQKV